MKWHRLNLMPHRMWARQAHRRRVVREVWWAAGVVLLLVGAAWGLLMVQRQAQQTLIVEYRQRLAQAQSVALQHQQAKRSMAQIQSQRQAAQALWQHQVDVLILWGQVAKALPAGVYLSEIKLSPSVRSLTGVVTHEADALAMQQALAPSAPGWQAFELVELSAQASTANATATQKRFVLRALPTAVQVKP